MSGRSNRVLSCPFRFSYVMFSYCAVSRGHQSICKIFFLGFILLPIDPHLKTRYQESASLDRLRNLNHVCNATSP